MTETDPLYNYILQHIDREPEYLKALYRDTHVKLLRPRMASGPLQGQFLRMLTQMMGARRVLEIGTYSGYSALCMASAMPKDGELYTFEINDEQEVFTRPWLEGAPYPPRIHLIVGDVFQLLDDIPGQFDLAFIDANKRQYIDYYELVLPRLRPGGVLIADNTLWDGHVVDPEYAADAQTRAICAFNDYLVADARVEQVVLPIRDGLTLVRRR